MDFILPSAAELFASILFSTIGFAAFMYGKKSAHFQPMLVGVALMIYPYFISGTALLYGVGIVLCAALYWWRD